MARNFVQPGKQMNLVAPYDRTSGQGALIGSIFGVALADVLSAASGDFALTGVWTLAKTSAQAWTLGQKIYWDDTNKRCDSDGTVGPLIGVAEVAANPSTTGNVRLNGSCASTLEGPEGAVADLTDNSGGATADGTIGAVTLPTLAGWNGSTDPTAAEATQIINACTTLRDAIKELSTKQNALLAALRLGGVILP